MLFPTRKHLERLQASTSVDSLFAAAAAAAPITPVRPRLRVPGDPRAPLLPGEPGYDSATG